METEIKKVNSLEELKNLKVGEEIQSKRFGVGETIIFESYNKGTVNFIEEELNPDKVLFTRTYGLNGIEFVDGMIHAHSFLRRVYKPFGNEYQEKLKLIQGVKK